MSATRKVLPSTPSFPSAGDPPIPPQGLTRLITQSDDVQVYTANRETDARTALARGLKEYIEQLSIDVPGGRQFRFKKVFSSYAEPEDAADYPSACVTTPGPGVYEAVGFAPQPATNQRVAIEGNDGLFLVTTSELAIDLQVEIWATDPEERMGLLTMLEDALSPVEFRFGTRLELPHYFGERADYEPTGMSYIDDDLSGVQRYRRAIVTVHGRVPVSRLKRLPLAKVRVPVTVTSGDC